MMRTFRRGSVDKHLPRAVHICSLLVAVLLCGSRLLITCLRIAREHVDAKVHATNAEHVAACPELFLQSVRRRLSQELYELLWLPQQSVSLDLAN